MQRPRARLALGLGIPVFLFVLLIATYAIDAASASGKVPRNVELGGRDIGKLPEDELASTVADLADHYADIEVQVRTGETTYKVPAGELGLALDQQTTVESALAVERETALPARPFVWASSFLDAREAEMSFTVDSAAMERGLAELGGDSSAAEPRLVTGPSGIGIVSGVAGTRVDSTGVREQLLRRARSGEEPIIVDVSLVNRAPVVTDAEARRLADELNATTAAGLAVTADDVQAIIPSGTVRSWISSQVSDGTLEVVLDDEAVLAALTDALPLDPETRDAIITLSEGAVVILPSQNGRACCGPETVEQIGTALESGQATVTVELEVTEADFTTEEAEALEIKEPVGGLTEWNGQAQVRSFTTYHACCAPRVHNIQRMADQVRGTVVEPGETFSINEVVGERTAAKGYVAAGAIANGEHVDEIGGGVSQFATTMFNAAYFAGLDITTYQAHSEYFSRYPRGREATMGFPNPDLAWKNDTPYGILVWTSYTDTSITVTLWSTQHAYSEQTGSTERRSGNCTIVTTERTTHYPDGRKATDDFSARYRDPGRTTC